MICNQLNDHWFMCRTMRLDSDPALRQKAHQYFMARKTTLLPSPLQTKAVGYVDDVIAARRTQ